MSVSRICGRSHGLLRCVFLGGLRTPETTPRAARPRKTEKASPWGVYWEYRAPIDYQSNSDTDLMRNQTTMLVHTHDGQQRQFTLVRLPDLQQGGANDTPTPAQK